MGSSCDRHRDSHQQQRRNSARPFHAAPIVELNNEQADHTAKPSKMHGFLRIFGLSCLLKSGRGSRSERRYTLGGRRSRATRREADGAALRAITIEDARFAFSRNVLDSEDGSVYSSHRGGELGVSHQQQYVLFLGSEHNANIKTHRAQLWSGLPEDPESVELKSLRPSMHERQTPVFFVPPPADIVASVTPRRRVVATYTITPPDSPTSVCA